MPFPQSIALRNTPTAPYRTVEELEAEHPDWLVHFIQHAEALGYPPDAWPAKPLWSPRALEALSGRLHTYLPTNIPFNAAGERPTAAQLHKAHSRVSNMYKGLLNAARTAFYLPMHGVEWWAFGDHVIARDPASLFAWCTASCACDADLMGQDVQEVLGALIVPRGRGRPGNGAREARAERGARYAAWLAACVALRTQQDELRKVHHDQVEVLRAEQRQQLAQLRAVQDAELRVLTAPSFSAYKG